MPLTSLRLHFQDPRLDYELLRTTAYEAYGGAAIGECLAAAEQVREGDPATWVRAWESLADRVARQAQEAAAKNRFDTAREAWLRASNYYRAAQRFAPAGGMRQREVWARGRACFREAAGIAAPRFESLDIPFQGKTLPGYLFPAANGFADPRPALVVVGGLEGAGEEGYFLGGVPPATRRGYHCVVFHGPGQPGVVHEDPGLVLRPDYEEVVRAVVDHAAGREEVDADRVALAGWGLGGHFAARAAATDQRIGALVAHPPVLDVRQHILAQWAGMAGDIASGALDLAPGMLVDLAVRWMERRDPVYEAGFERLAWALGVREPAEALHRLDAFKLAGLEGNIRCPTLCLVGEADGGEGIAQARAFHAAIDAPKDLRVLTRAEGADAHMGLNNLPLVHQLMLDWLDAAWSETPLLRVGREPEPAPEPETSWD